MNWLNKAGLNKYCKNSTVLKQKTIEPDNAPWRSVKGLDKIMEKFKAWNDSIAVFHHGKVTKPLVASSYFTCTLKMDITRKNGSRIVFEEVAVYEVKDGKIVTDQFFYET